MNSKEISYIQLDLEEHELLTSVWPLTSIEFETRVEDLDWLWEARIMEDEERDAIEVFEGDRDSTWTSQLG